MLRAELFLGIFYREFLLGNLKFVELINYFLSAQMQVYLLIKHLVVKSVFICLQNFIKNETFEKGFEGFNVNTN